MSTNAQVPRPGYKFIYRRSIFNKKLNRRIYASAYGKKAFRLEVPE